ncbi:MAG: DUF1543 domain-containing protein [Bacteroidia bacterium]|nr:DUF1543 domain-containing protein [Bacteroidia bacterium]
MGDLKLYMLLLGCRPEGRHTEQHDIFFGIGYSLKDLIPHIKACWPEAKGNIHIDAWREVTSVDGYSIKVFKEKPSAEEKELNLYFINLGGYKEGEFEEPHYKVLAVSENINGAMRKSKQTIFFKTASITGKEGASHIDDKYGIDIDDAYNVKELLPEAFRSYHLQIVHTGVSDDEINLGYVPLRKIV